MDRTDVLAYLFVLGDKSVPHPPNLLGCLHRVQEQLERYHPALAAQVRERERVNGIKPYGDPELVALTNALILNLRAII